ncbi:MAG: class I SAM-dependent RNA methyltransferase [Cryobacterium sp.]|nr:class I SAM-dependent RNA methyltransferase [Oligoflexia bacterium]
MDLTGNSQKILNGLQVLDLSRGGNGVARQDLGGEPPTQRVVFIPLSMPGDVVSVRVVKEEKRFATAEIVKIETPAGGRLSPPCSVFGVCGGCTWQHVPYALQWKTKRDGIIQALSRTGVIPRGENPPPMREFQAEKHYGYRNRIQLRARMLPDGSEATLGYFARGSKTLVDVPRCEIAREELNGLLPEIRKESTERLKKKNSVGEKDPELKIELEVMPDGTTRKSWNARTGVLGFRQVNDDQNENLLAFVRENLSKGAHLLDLFGGAGNFSLGDADRYVQVDCVDVGSPEGGSPDQPSNYKFYPADVAKWLGRRQSEKMSGSFRPRAPLEAILDPPREGFGDAAARIVTSLDALGVGRIIAIGCDADSWAKDVAKLVQAGWKITQLAAFDLFPQTPHVEAVAVLERAD